MSFRNVEWTFEMIQLLHGSDEIEHLVGTSLRRFRSKDSAPVLRAGQLVEQTPDNLEADFIKTSYDRFAPALRVRNRHVPISPSR